MAIVNVPANVEGGGWGGGVGGWWSWWCREPNLISTLSRMMKEGRNPW